MRQKKNNAKVCEQYVAFLVRQDERKVYIDVTSSKDPAAVLRKHRRGDDDDTRAYFSKLNPQAEPVMWLWKAGEMTRGKAKTFVLEWERLFAAEGYEIVGSKIPDSFRRNPHTLSDSEQSRVRELGVSGLLKGDGVEKIECGAEGGDRKSAAQKYTKEPTNEILRIRAKGETVDCFRRFCKKEGLTQGQGIELLMSSYTKDADLLVLDLRERLERANDNLVLKEEKIGELQKALKMLEEGKDYPKKYRRAELQGKLLREFFRRLPDHPTEKKLHIHSNLTSKQVFPQRETYQYPKTEGVISMTLEHAHYSRGPYACVFIYGRDAEGNRIKIRTYFRKENAFGEPLRNSAYFCPNTRWLFAIQAEGEAMEIVGALPDPGRIRVDEEKGEEEYWKNYREQIAREIEELDALDEKEVVGECKEQDYDILGDKMLSLDEKIMMIEKLKKKNNG